MNPVSSALRQMMRPYHTAMHRSVLLTGVAAGVLACGDSPRVCNVMCVYPPPSIVARVTNAATGAPITFASLLVSGAVSATVPCDSAGACTVRGQPGTYNLTIIATGYQSAQRSVTVRGTVGACGCYDVTTENIAVGLTQAAAEVR